MPFLRDKQLALIEGQTTCPFEGQIAQVINGRQHHAPFEGQVAYAFIGGQTTCYLFERQTVMSEASIK